MPDRGTGDLERDLERDLDYHLTDNTEYAISVVLSCGVICIGLTLVGCIVAALIAWL